MHCRQLRESIELGHQKRTATVIAPAEVLDWSVNEEDPRLTSCPIHCGWPVLCGKFVDGVTGLS